MYSIDIYKLFEIRQVSSKFDYLNFEITLNLVHILKKLSRDEIQF